LIEQLVGMRAGISAVLYSPDYNPIEEAFAEIKNLLSTQGSSQEQRGSDRSD
jgi:transposase